MFFVVFFKSKCYSILNKFYYLIFNTIKFNMPFIIVSLGKFIFKSLKVNPPHLFRPKMKMIYLESRSAETMNQVGV